MGKGGRPPTLWLLAKVNFRKQFAKQENKKTDG